MTAKNIFMKTLPFCWSKLGLGSVAPSEPKGSLFEYAFAPSMHHFSWILTHPRRFWKEEIRQIGFYKTHRNYINLLKTSMTEIEFNKVTAQSFLPRSFIDAPTW